MRKLLTAYAMLTALFVGIGVFVHYTESSIKDIDYRISDARIQQIYKKIAAQTGNGDEVPPLLITDTREINAYTNGSIVVLYRGMINFTQNEDEIALVLGHELAHVMLRHTQIKKLTLTSKDAQLAEANSDKMGAFYAMKAGYDVCRARMMWKRLLTEEGDRIGSTHPPYSHRYNELNVLCE
jgi:predicted Zn-dependent protease